MGDPWQGRRYTGVERRAAPRIRVRIPLRARRAGEPWFACRIADLSGFGFCLHSFCALVPGERISIMFPGYEARGAWVIWNMAHEAGCLLERPLHPAVLDHLFTLGDVVPTGSSDLGPWPL